MSVQAILEYPDPRLKQRSEPVARFDGRVSEIVDDLFDTMYAHTSIGLSAPQIDERRQILVMDHSRDQSDPQVFINPKILAKAGFGLAEERCLSVPDVVAHVFRPTKISVRAYKANGDVFEVTLQGMPAVCLQHELDHFDGLLLADRINWFRRRRLLAKLEKRASPVPATASSDQTAARAR